MRKNKIKKSQYKQIEKWIQRNVKHPIFSFLLIAGLALGVFYYNEIYIYKHHTSVSTQISTGEIRCVDGDTFVYGNERIRLLAIDTPETVKPNHPVEPYGQEASDYTCGLIENAKEITFKQDPGNEVDKYGRTLAWVYVDDQLLQKLLIERGFAEIKYVQKSTVDKKILKELEHAEQLAQKEGIGIWSLND